MSSAPSPTNPPLPPPNTPPVKSDGKGTPVGAVSQSTDQLIVYRHSNMFYWWPVWVVGGLFALITFIDNQYLVIVPSRTEAAVQRDVAVDDKGTMEKRDVLILDKNQHLGTRKNDQGEAEPVQPIIHMTRYRTLGTLYAIVLLLVITITNISIRGLWTVFFMVSIIMLAIIFAAAGWWETIFQRLNQLSIYINMGGYILISGVLFLQWALNFYVFDRRTYMVFTPGQVRVRIEIGGEETVFDTLGMVVERLRGDVFRHWILGFGSGDLIIKPVGLEHPLVFPNVLFVETIVKKIEQLTKQRVVVNTSVPKNP